MFEPVYGLEVLQTQVEENGLAVPIPVLAGVGVWPTKHRVERDLARDFGQLAAFKDLGKSEEEKQQTLKMPL